MTSSTAQKQSVQVHTLGTKVVEVMLPGVPGMSAYQLAVANGYSGDIISWLASLVGPKGDPGEKGDTGTGITVLDTYDTYDKLLDEHPVGAPGDAYLIKGVLYIWSQSKLDWINTGQLLDTGQQVPVLMTPDPRSYFLEVLNSYSSPEEDTNISTLDIATLDTLVLA